MAKIENTTVYPLVTPNASDFVIGTDTSDDNRTVSFKISDITASGGLQDLQSVLDTPTTNTGGTAAGDISLTGNITVNGTVYPTTITAGGSTGTAGQLLSSTATGIQWIDVPINPCCSLDDTLAIGNTTTQDIITSGSIGMIGASQGLSLINSSVITLGNNCSITTEDDIRLALPSCVLDFNAGASISDGNNSLGTSGQIFTRGAAGVEWSTGIPAASMPTLQEVLNAGNTATGIGMQFIGSSITTFSTSSIIQSLANNVWSGTNEFGGNGGTPATSGINLTGSLSDSVGTGTSGQVLTSTVTGVSWADLSTIGVSSVSATVPIAAAFPADPITIAPGVGGVIVRQNIYAGGSLIGCVPTGGTASNFLRGDGTWVTPTGAVSSVSVLASGTSGGLTDAIKISPTTGAVQVQSNAFDGSDKVGHVPDSSAAVQNTTFLRADGTWQVPAGGGAAAAPEWVNKYVINNSKFNTVSGSYYVNAGVSEANQGSPTAMYNTLNSASAPSVVAVTNARFPNNLIQLNPGIGGCTTGYPDHILCQVAYQFYASKSSTVAWELWRVPIAGGTAAAAVAASEAIVYTAGNLTTGTFTIGASNVLSANQGFVLTYRDNTGMTNEQIGMTLFFKYKATV
jgi:hypothetical protein